MTNLPVEPPFLELALYIDESNDVWRQLRVLVPDIHDPRPGRLSLPNMVGLSDKLEQIEIEKEAILILRTEGEAFCGTARLNRGRLMKLGLRAYKRFVQVADLLDCAYGAILVEYTLETPSELRRDSRSLAFRDFYVSRSNLGLAAVDECIRLAGPNACVEAKSNGAYISMSEEFNPSRKRIESADAQDRSCRIGAFLAQTAR